MAHLNYYEYEIKVANELAEALECSYSDASGVLEANVDFVKVSYMKDVSYKVVADELIDLNADKFLNDEK